MKTETPALLPQTDTVALPPDPEINATILERPMPGLQNGAHPAACHGISLFDETTKFGFENYTLRFQIDGKSHIVEQFTAKATADGKDISGEASLGVAVGLKLRALGKRRYILQVSLENKGRKACLLEQASFGQYGSHATFHPGESHVLGWALHYAHTGNLRTERYPFCAADYPYLRHLPTELRSLGDTEDQPFPALFLFNEIARCGMVLGMTSQVAATPVFKMRRRALFRPDTFEVFAMDWEFPQCRGLTIPANGRLELESIYLQLTQDVGPDLAYEDYLNYLESENDFRGHTSPMKEEALHCTWNYGVFNDQRAEPLLKTAHFIAKEVPNIKWFLMDDGYLGEVPRRRGFLNCFYPNPNAYLKKEDWPNGIRAFTDEVRSLGLRPGLWWTPTVLLPCQLHDDHPDWFLRKADGSLYLIDNKNAYLDYSHPEALAFLDRTLAVILGEWGIDACKIDFYSQNFETREAVLHRPNCTSIQVRRQFFETVRRHLPPDGVIMSCIAMGMGNPFLGEHIDTYRCSMDISDGLWQDQINSCRWTLPALGWGGRRSLLLNTDSVGINPKLPDNENRFRLTWCYITMGIIETGGRLEQLSPDHLRDMKKVISRGDRGYPCRCPDLRAYTGDPLPEALYVDFPAESHTAKSGIRQSLALFNWTDTPRAVSVHRKQVGHPEKVRAVDFWTGNVETWDRDFITVELPPRSSRLFDLSW